MEELLKQIARNTKPKESYQFIVTDNKTEFTHIFNTPIKLDKESHYEIALVNLETWYSFPNVDSTNNVLKYSNDNGASWYEILIPEGSYELDAIDSEIARQMKQRNHYDRVRNQSYIKLSPNNSTLKSVMEIDGNYKVDFRVPNSINTILGFKNKVYHAGYNESEDIVNILAVSSIFIEIDIINGSYVNGKRQPIIYSFFPAAEPGYKIVENPRNLVYLPVNMNEISKMNVRLTDQNGKLLNLRGENITMRLHMRGM